MIADRKPDPSAELKRKALGVLFWSLAAALAFNLLFGDMGLLQGIRQKHSAARLRREVEALGAENARIDADIRDLRQDPYRIEAIAREELGLSRPGEITFLFQEPDAEAAAPLSREPAPPTGTPGPSPGPAVTPPGDPIHP